MGHFVRILKMTFICGLFAIAVTYWFTFVALAYVICYPFVALFPTQPEPHW